MPDIKVSIICITYNQEDYIEQAIKSFLMQKTNFEYEIIIHDDASTDKTPEIISRYVEKYSGKIRFIKQEENQHSKGAHITNDFILPIAKGEYCALCEGDDYWVDDLKLQKQYDFMSSHPEYSMCIHDAYVLYKDRVVFYPNVAPSNREYDIKDAIMGLGISAPTNSFFFKKSSMDEMMKFTISCPVGDYSRPIQAAMHGPIYYFHERMSVHRMLAKNSFSSRMASGKNITKKWDNFYDRLKISLSELDEETNKEYTEIIEKSYQNQRFRNFLSTNNKQAMKQEPYKSLFKNLSMIERVKFRIPFVYGKLQLIRYALLDIKFRIFPERDIYIDG